MQNSLLKSKIINAKSPKNSKVQTYKKHFLKNAIMEIKKIEEDIKKLEQDKI